MKLGVRWWWFLAFTAVFAVLAGFVFWGTWSPSVAPVMPDSQLTYPADWLWRQWRQLVETGKFSPVDLRHLIGTPDFRQELRYVLAIYLAALGVAYYCFGRGLPQLAGYGAGLLLAFCGYWVTLFSAGHFGWYLWMMTGVFAFGLVDRLVSRDSLRHALLLGAVVAWSSFNQQDLWLLFTVLTAVYFGWCCVRERKLPWKGALLALAAFAVVGMPNFLETVSTALKGREEQIARQENVTNKSASAEEQRWEFVTNWSLPADETVEFVRARVNGDTSCPFVLSVGMRNGNGIKPYTGALGRPMSAPRGNYRQHSLYVGWCICLLALVGVVTCWRSRRRGEIGFFAVMALVCYALSLGRYFEPAYRIVFALPFGDLIRCPVKWHHLTEFCLVVLAAYGIAYLLELKWRSSRVRMAVVGALVLLGAVDLAVEAKRYCAPINVTVAQRQRAQVDLTVLSRKDFANPQVAAMVREQRIVSVANYLGNPDYFVVQALRPFDPYRVRPVAPLRLALGILSLLASLAIIGGCGCRPSLWSGKN